MGMTLQGAAYSTGKAERKLNSLLESLLFEALSNKAFLFTGLKYIACFISDPPKGRRYSQKFPEVSRMFVPRHMDQVFKTHKGTTTQMMWESFSLLSLSNN